MKKLISFVPFALLTGCSQDWFNRMSRKVVEYRGGNTEKTRIVRNDKATSTDKGYYYFWEEHRHYVQTPLDNTFVEEF
ncbi:MULTISPECIES: hypothetical protein [Methylomicrobium]|uniref:Lipoprotein n=1 Tax=Methylomicrobium album BG8 TaxID=686340 RepID=H8GGY0_METAL|nr:MULTISPECIES: hypothetical protein [Methylomicrobium]EIC31255.1 hypothetical protein Metal_3608 [Methylomicrobium album BG8]